MSKNIVMEVLDISSYQKELSDSAVEKIKRQKVGVILRCGFTGYGKHEPAIDPYFIRNYTKLHNAGVPCGAYYFTLAANSAIALKEINFIKDTLKDLPLELPVYIDVEAQANSLIWTTCSKANRTANVAMICEALESAGYYVGIYANKSWFANKLDESKLKKFDKWIAQYNSTCTYTGNYNLWQYSSSEPASAYGITGTTRVDISHAYVDFPSIIRNKGLNNTACASNDKMAVCPYCGQRFMV